MTHNQVITSNGLILAYVMQFHILSHLKYVQFRFIA